MHGSFLSSSQFSIWRTTLELTAVSSDKCIIFVLHMVLAFESGILHCPIEEFITRISIELWTRLITSLNISRYKHRCAWPLALNWVHGCLLNFTQWTVQRRHLAHLSRSGLQIVEIYRLCHCSMWKWRQRNLLEIIGRFQILHRQIDFSLVPL